MDLLMSLKSCVTESANRRKLEVQVSAEDFAKEVEKAYRKAAPKINIPGFRKGKAPRNIIEKMYGKEFFYEDAVNAVYPNALDEAIKEGELDYVDDKVDLDVTSVGEDGLTFTAVITVKPEVSVGDYKGIKVSKPSVVVTENEINEEIEAVRERNARTIDAGDSPAKNGDTVVFDFEGFADEVPFEGGKAEDYKLVLGSGNFIPGFEEEMVGYKAGEEFDVNVTFPEEYHAEELAGKPAVFKIKLHEVKTKELPELDDEFAKDISEFDTFDEYKADVRVNLEKKAEEKAKDEIDSQIIEALVDLVDADIPEAMFNNRVEDNVKDFAYRLRSQGLNMDDYLRFTGAAIDDIREQFRAQAEKQVTLRLALEKIAALEEISVGEAEVEEEYKKLAEGYKMEIEAVKNAIPAEGIAEDLKADKAMALVRDSSEIDG